jgi:AcrR family transcriptional regulator
VATRGEPTRQRLLDVAEVLFAQHGVDYVSLREIRIAAEQRNVAAVQYHFGDRAGVLQAIGERHMPHLVSRIEALLVAAQATPDDLRSWVSVVVVPLAEYVERGPSEGAFLRIVADQQSRIPLEVIRQRVPEALEIAGNGIYERVGQRLPPDIASERIISVAQSVVHDCADRARVLYGSGGRPLLPADVFVANLVDMMTAALAAPSSLMPPGDPPVRERRAAPRTRTPAS